MTANWLKQALTGADNRTVAIGRLIGFAIAIVLLISLPLWAAWAISHQADDKARMGVADTWRELFEALGIYVPLVTGSITAIIRITNSTEPAPGRPDTPPNP